MSDDKGVYKKSLYSCLEHDPASHAVLIAALFEKLGMREVTFNTGELARYSGVDAEKVMDLIFDEGADTLTLKANDWVSEEESA